MAGLTATGDCRLGKSMTPQTALIIGLHGAVGGYLARLLQARGWRIAGTNGGDDRVCRRLGILDDVQIIDADAALRLAGDAASVIFACAEADIDLYDLAESAFAAAAGRSRLCHVAAVADLEQPRVRRLVQRVVAWRQSGEAIATNALLGAHDSRLGPADTLPAAIIRAAYAAAQGAAADAPTLVAETGPIDWGWTPEYVDAVARIATAPRPADLVVVSGHRLTAADIATHAFAYFRQPIADRLRIVDAITPQLPQVGSASALQAAIGWSAMTHGRDLVRAWCEGAADRA